MASIAEVGIQQKTRSALGNALRTARELPVIPTVFLSVVVILSVMPSVIAPNDPFVMEPVKRFAPPVWMEGETPASFWAAISWAAMCLAG